MKLLYIAPVIINLDKLDGVGKKVLAHVKVFSQLYQTILLFRDEKDVIRYDGTSTETRVIGPGSSKLNILKAAFDLVNREPVDCCYIRYPNSDPYFLRFLKELKKKKIKTVIEIPTFPYDKEGKESFRGRAVGLVDKWHRKKLKNYLDRIVTYSDDDFIYGIQTIRTINGFDFSKVDLAKTPQSKDTIHMCGVANIFRVHGYDRLIRGLQLYYGNGGKRDIIFDVVGSGDTKILNEYKALTNAAGLDDRIRFHGKLFGEELNRIYDEATIAVNSLAIHRQNLKNESTLKTKEYAAKGLPVLSSSYVDAFSREDNARYVYRVPPDETPINIREVIDFCDNLYLNTDLRSLRKTIREKASAICDMSVTLEPVIAFFNQQDA